jgi:hypothetical protein
MDSLSRGESSSLAAPAFPIDTMMLNSIPPHRALLANLGLNFRAMGGI